MKKKFKVGEFKKEVYDAYIKPVVDSSTAVFQWGHPDLHKIRIYVREKFGWSKEQIDLKLLPILNQDFEKQGSNQKLITSFFDVSPQKK